jgi:hypothetical protein
MISNKLIKVSINKKAEDVEEDDNLNALDMHELDKLAGNMTDEDKEDRQEDKDTGN